MVADPQGYLIFCLCMGRFGNQAEHFLGSLAFAKAINRTLILPPFRTYKNIEFDEWFKLDAVAQYHRVILAKDFMANFAEKIWPPSKRYGFCYQLPNAKEPCQMKIGNPFKNFWDELGVDFVETVGYDISYLNPEIWVKNFPPSKYPVIAMKGAPASFPMQQKHLPLQKYMKFSDSLLAEADDILQKHFNGSREYIGIHLRNGEDWIRTCEHAGESPQARFMASYQCQGFDYKIALKKEMCIPSPEAVIEKLKSIVEKTGLKFLLIATDKNPMLKNLESALPGMKIFHADPWLPILDAILLINSKIFVGNCVSSFSAFVFRQRFADGKGPTEYFGVS